MEQEIRYQCNLLLVILDTYSKQEHYLFYKHQQKTCFSNGIPVIDLLNPNVKTLIVKACEEYGFFKVINHGIPMELMSTLESEAVKFLGVNDRFWWATVERKNSTLTISVGRRRTEFI